MPTLLLYYVRSVLHCENRSQQWLSNRCWLDLHLFAVMFSTERIDLISGSAIDAGMTGSLFATCFSTERIDLISGSAIDAGIAIICLMTFFHCENRSQQWLSNRCWRHLLSWFLVNCLTKSRSSQQRLCIKGEDRPHPLLSNRCWHNRCWPSQLAAFILF